MDEMTIRLRENGPILVPTPVKIVDHLGNEIPVPSGKPTVALCRCGQSASKPFCDGSHKRVGFQGTEAIAPRTENQPPASPPTTV